MNNKEIAQKYYLLYNIYNEYTLFEDAPNNVKKKVNKEFKNLLKYINDENYSKLSFEDFIIHFKQLADFFLALEDSKTVTLTLTQLSRLINLYPKIKNAGIITQQNMDEMFSLYNDIYKRNEYNKSCSNCVRNVFNSIKAVATTYNI